MLFIPSCHIFFILGILQMIDKLNVILLMAIDNNDKLYRH